MARFSLAVGFLVACQHAPAAAPGAPCPGPYAIERGACDHVPATACKGICGYVVRRSSCAPVRNAIVTPAIMNGTMPSAASDDSGRFDLAGLSPGHYVLRVMADQDEGRFELDVVEGPQPLAGPIELTLFDRTCGCGGVCPT